MSTGYSQPPEGTLDGENGSGDDGDVQMAQIRHQLELTTKENQALRSQVQAAEAGFDKVREMLSQERAEFEATRAESESRIRALSTELVALRQRSGQSERAVIDTQTQLQTKVAQLEEFIMELQRENQTAKEEIKILRGQLETASLESDSERRGLEDKLRDAMFNLSAERQKNADQASAIGVLNQQLSSRDAELNNLRNENMDKDRERLSLIRQVETLKSASDLAGHETQQQWLQRIASLQGELRVVQGNLARAKAEAMSARAAQVEMNDQKTSFEIAMRAEVSQLKEKLNAADAQLAEAQQQLGSESQMFKKQIGTLEEQIKTLKQDISHRDEVITMLQSEIDAQVSQYEDALECTRNDLGASLRESTLAVENQRLEFAKLTARQQELEALLREKQVELESSKADFDAQVSQAHAQHDELVEALNKKQAEIEKEKQERAQEVASLGVAVEKAQDDLSTRASELEITERKLTESERRNTQLNKEIQALKNKIASLNGVIREKEVEMQENATALERAKMELKITTGTLKAMEGRIASQGAMRRSSESIIDQSTEEFNMQLERMTQEVAVMRSAKQALESQTKTLSQQNEALRDRLSEANNELASIKQKLIDATTEQERLRNEKDAIQRSSADQLRNLTERSTKNEDELRKQIAALKHQIEKHVNELTASSTPRGPLSLSLPLSPPVPQDGSTSMNSSFQARTDMELEFVKLKTENARLRRANDETIKDQDFRLAAMRHEIEDKEAEFQRVEKLLQVRQKELIEKAGELEELRSKLDAIQMSSDKYSTSTQEEINRLKKQVEELQQAFEEKTSAYNLIKEENNALHRELETVASDRDAWASSLGDKDKIVEETMDYMRQQLSEARHNSSQLEEKIVENEKQIEMREGRISELEEEIESMKESIKEQEEKASHDIAEVEAMLNESQSKIEAILNDVKERDEKIKSLETAIDQITEENSQTVKSLNGIIAEREKAVAALREELANEKDMTSELASQARELESQLSTKIADYEDAKRAIEDLTDQIKSTRAAHDELFEQHQNVCHEKEVLVQRVEDADVRTTQLEQQNEELVQRLSDISQTNAENEARATSLMDEMQILRDNQESVMVEVNDQLLKLSTTNTHLAKQLATCNELIASLIQERDNAVATIDELSTQLSQVHVMLATRAEAESSASRTGPISPSAQTFSPAALQENASMSLIPEQGRVKRLLDVVRNDYEQQLMGIRAQYTAVRNSNASLERALKEALAQIEELRDQLYSQVGMGISSIKAEASQVSPLMSQLGKCKFELQTVQRKFEVVLELLNKERSQHRNETRVLRERILSMLNHIINNDQTTSKDDETSDGASLSLLSSKKQTGDDLQIDDAKIDALKQRIAELERDLAAAHIDDAALGEM